MAKTLTLCFLLLVAVAAASGTFLKASTGKPIRFHTIGDQGFYPIPGYFTDGTPLFEMSELDKANLIDVPNQYVADKMSEVAQENPIDFVIGVGDNFYQLPNGLKSIDDPRVSYMLNKTYGLPGLDVPFYMILGNHDCYGNPQLQVEETKIHKKWNMPATYYEQVFEIDNGKKALFLFLDGCVLSQADAVKDGSVSHDFSFPVTKDMVDTQIAWIESTLAKYADDDTIAWRTVSVHWPFFSIGRSHGDTDPLKFNVLPILGKYNVDVLLSGHEHNSMYINMDYDVIRENKMQPGEMSQKDCTIAPIGIEDSKDLHFTQGEQIHQFGVGNSGVPPGPACKSRYTEYENVHYAAWINGFVEIEVSSEAFVVTNWAAHTENFLTKVTIDAAAPAKVESENELDYDKELEEMFTLFEQLISF